MDVNKEIGSHKFIIRPLTFGQEMDITDVSTIVEVDQKVGRMVQRAKGGTAVVMTICYGVKWWDLSDNGKPLNIDELTIRERLYEFLSKEDCQKLAGEIDSLSQINKTEKKTLQKPLAVKLEPVAPISTAHSTTKTPSETEKGKPKEQNQNQNTDT